MNDEHIRRLCWIAWRMGSIGSGDDISIDQFAFRQWWEDNAEFLKNNLPIPASQDYDDIWKDA